MAPVPPSAAAQKAPASSRTGQPAGMTEVKYDYGLLAGGVEIVLHFSRPTQDQKETIQESIAAQWIPGCFYIIF